MQFLAGARLKEARKKLGLTQREMAEKIGVRQSYYSDIENGRRTLTNKFIDRVASKIPDLPGWISVGKVISSDAGEFLGEDGSVGAEAGVPSKSVLSELGNVLLDKTIAGTLQQLSFYATDLLLKIRHIENPPVQTRGIEKYAEGIREYVASVRGHNHLEGIISGPSYRHEPVDEKLRLLSGLNEKLTEALDVLWQLDREGAWTWTAC